MTESGFNITRHTDSNSQRIENDKGGLHIHTHKEREGINIISRKTRQKGEREGEKMKKAGEHNCLEKRHSLINTCSKSTNDTIHLHLRNVNSGA